MFEHFFENFMAWQEGFEYINKHCRSEVGEIDYFYRSKLQDHPLWQKYPFFFIECKNWKETISSEKMNHFIRLVKGKASFFCCGVYITTSSFSPQATTTMRDARLNEKILVIPIDKSSLSSLIEKGFKDLLQEICEQILAKG